MRDKMTIEETINGLQDMIESKKFIENHYDGVVDEDVCERAIELLKEQEPKSGHWIDSVGADKCSVCGATYGDLYPDYQNTHYCPNCGAKMIGQAVSLND